MPLMPVQKSLHTLTEFIDRGLIDEKKRAALEPVAERYALALTNSLADLIDPNDPSDPIARQFVPSPAEAQTSAGEQADPTGDFRFQPVKGIVHRYPDRVLLKPVHACPVYCRFCFRREQVGPGADRLNPAELETAVKYIAAHSEIWEVIITGGDPLILSPRRIEDLLQRLNAIPHVKIVRFHTRIPIADPDRVTDALIAAMRKTNKTIYVAVHCNHKKELSAAATDACRKLSRAGISLLGQTVLLRGVNDSAEALADLFRALVEQSIKPYYLHHPDRAPGTGHFYVGIKEGQALMRALRGKISGLCLPTYVLDIPEGEGKSPIGPTYAHRQADGSHIVEDYKGISHRYDSDR